jgi:hypothetical protein
MGAIEIKTVQNRKDLMQFIKLPWKIYQDDPNWVPPLIADRKKLLDKVHNPFFQHAEMEMFLAFRNGELVGRIAGITNENHNKFQEDNVGFFGFYESTDDPEVTAALFGAVRAWLKDKGKDGMMGPMNPSTNDEAGLLIKGFDSPPYVMMCHNPAYYQKLFEDYGLKKAKDLYAWYLDVRNYQIPERLLEISQKSMQRYKITLRNLKIKDLKNELKLVLEVYNNAWSRNWGFVPMTTEEILHAANDLKQIADEDFLFIAEREGRPIGFSVTLPNINEVLIKVRDGKLFPTGLFKLLTGMKKIRNVRVVMLGIITEFQKGGLGSVFYVETLRRAMERGLDGGEMSWILEDNYPMNSAIEMFGSKCYKTYRIYHDRI